MRVKIIIALACLGCLIGGSLGGFYFGLKIGAQNVRWRSDTETAGVLLHAFKLRDAGEADKSASVLNTLLYLSADGTDRYRDNLLLTEDNRKAGEKCLQAVADYYWSHPASFSLQWERTNDLPAGALGQAMMPAVEMYGERHKRIAEILVARRKVEPDGAANRSQPIRSETNRTSSAAGSDR
jgi:hypothetical protein